MSWAEYLIVLTYLIAGYVAFFRTSKVGGLYFFRLGRLGGSVYWAKHPR